jgi:hypothetical protein
MYIRGFFAEICAAGHLRVAEYLASIWNISKKERLCAIEWACLRGYTRTAQYVLTMTQSVSYYFPDFKNARGCFTRVCAAGHWETAEWFAKTFHVVPGDFERPCPLNPIYSTDVTARIAHSRRYFTRTINQYRKVSKLFRSVCERGHLHVAEQLVTWLELPDAEVKSYFTRGFASISEVYTFGRLDVLQWLINRFDLADILIHREWHWIMRAVCSHGHLVTAQWLLSQVREPVTHHHSLDNAFDNACVGGHILMAEWMADTLPIQAKISLKDNMIQCLRNDKVDMAEWLCNRFGAVLLLSPDIMDVIKTDNPEAIQWLYNHGCRFAIEDSDSTYYIPRGPGWSIAFQVACQTGRLLSARRLALLIGVTPQLVNYRDWTPAGLIQQQPKVCAWLDSLQ